MSLLLISHPLEDTGAPSAKSSTSSTPCPSAARPPLSPRPHQPPNSAACTFRHSATTAGPPCSATSPASAALGHWVEYEQERPGPLPSRPVFVEPPSAAGPQASELP